MSANSDMFGVVDDFAKVSEMLASEEACDPNDGLGSKEAFLDDASLVLHLNDRLDVNAFPGNEAERVNGEPGGQVASPHHLLVAQHFAVAGSVLGDEVEEQVHQQPQLREDDEGVETVVSVTDTCVS